jgi:ATP-binding cassette subfamily C (CFTR/MRP) protein 1
MACLSGKSSVVALLLHMLDPLPPLNSSSSSPSILIDETPLDKVDRTALRRRLIAVSQDAVFLPEGSSFRTNLDPWNAALADEARLALEAVGLQDVVNQRGGIDSIMEGAELSAGQKQMFALGRAVLRRRVRARRFAELGLAEGGILLLDEMTASVDEDMEKTMSEIVKHEFAAYTVVTVTHSVEMAKEYDRVIILDKGRIMEDGDPRKLINEEGTWFRKLATAGSG